MRMTAGMTIDTAEMAEKAMRMSTSRSEGLKCATTSDADPVDPVYKSTWNSSLALRLLWILPC